MIHGPEARLPALLACHPCVGEETRAWEVMARGHAGFVGGKVGPRSQHSGSLPAPGQKLRCKRRGGRREGWSGGSQGA